MKTVVGCMLISTLSIAAGSAPAGAQMNAHRYPLSTEAIARALHSDGLDVQTADMRTPMLLSSAVSDPALEVVGADRMPDGHLRLRLRCHRAGECLPFSVTLIHSSAAPVLLTSTLPPVASTRPGGSSVASVLPEATSRPALADTVAISAEPVFVHAGARLILLLDEGHLHMHLPVVSLDSAAVDQSMRVATLDRKHTYRATVLSATTVRGSME